MKIISEENYLAHYGILRRSGRYPWGSGGTAVSRSKTFLDYIHEMRKQGMSETEIARGVGMTTTELRATNSIARNQVKQADIARATRLKEKGYQTTKIGEIMGRNESSIRALLADGEKEKADILQSVASMLKKNVDEKGMIDIGSGNEAHIGVSTTRLATAVAMLKAEGYVVHPVKIQQLGTGEKTELKVLAKPGTTQREVFLNRKNIKFIQDYSDDGGRSFMGVLPPLNISSKRVEVKYAEDGGGDADGVIYVRPGSKDLSLGGKHYAQVRIAVDGTHYLKGMAIYRDDLPSGVDLQFNTGKSRAELGNNKLDAMKPLKRDKEGNIDMDNPFGSVVRQIGEKDAKGGLKRVTSAMNLVNEEGDWGEWSKSLSSQMLSKQSTTLAREQLAKTYDKRQKDFDEIMGLTNPAVKKKLLEDFAGNTDSAAVHLKAASLPRQGTHVILPIKGMKDTEVYAPNFDHGESVVLIRYPHGGVFEIPELRVNNRHAEAKRILGPQPPDAIGISSGVAKRLSGADFDGDTVLVIPNNNGRIRTAPALKDLKDFDPQSRYPAYPGMPKMSPRTKQTQMGVVSNLITDMTIRGATPGEIARAVKHSMVVIDAEKHNLNWKQSEKDQGIAALKAKYQTPYQPSGRPGASTLISRAGGEKDIPERKLRSARRGGPVDPKTGELVYEPTGATKVKRRIDKKTGAIIEEVVPKTIKVERLAYTKDARTLSSGTQMEEIYAAHSNKLKALANKARKESVNIKSIPYNPSAKKVYSTEVASLNAKLNLARRNRPLERQAQILAGAAVSAKRAANPDMDEAEIKKLKSMALTEYRTRTGAQKISIRITPDEWEAIQAGAITQSKLSEILKKADMEVVKQLAMPKQNLLMTAAKTQRAQALLSEGRTQAEVAAILGVSLTTLKTTLKEG